MSTESTTERIARLRLWVAGYRTLMKSGIGADVHTAATEASRIDDDTFAHLSIEDVEWLLKTIDLSRSAAAEMRIEMGKGSVVYRATFAADFPASAALARAFPASPTP